ncbi:MULTISPECIES: DUF2530 domain-containing protein [Amycolatopsis]|uniref:Uncharacterized protein DUF2530 n=1 Tax=Amycolatopsis thermoflava TaxID=84480 RepID=A0A3N2GYT5_9PSEU|nr:uncharacterized protein DUF2530 [Amycolatopsis thermoflava]
MADPINAGDVKRPLLPVPELPERLVVLYPVVAVGTLVWFAGFLVLGGIRLFGTGGPASVWMWTCLSGGVLGLMGMGIMSWQRWARRHGSRSAQTGL